MRKKTGLPGLPLAPALAHKGRGSGRFDLLRLREEIKPFRLHYFSRLRSTNDHAAVMRKRGELFAPAMVLTAQQTAGRGRGSNTWWSNGGVMTVTFAVAIDQAWGPHQVPLVAGVAVRRAVAELTANDEIKLKWPNDLLFEGRKLAGLLCERIDKVDLIGLGLNVNVDPAKAPKAIRARVTSLYEILGRRFNLTDVLICVAEHLHRMMSRQDQNFAQVLKEYDRYHALVGREVCIDVGETRVRGKCEGLDRMGRLLLRDGAKVHQVISGQVESF